MRFAAKRAIILAAGRGLRLAPLTDHIPKPLLVFDKKPVIENIIERVLALGISDIVVVVGYKSDLFSYLTEKYKGVKLHFNPRWESGNNILSVNEVVDLCEDALIINGDAIITRSVLVKDYERTVMYADRSRGPSKEWELIVDQSGFVKKINTLGGNDILQHREITFISANDFLRFKSEVQYRAAQKSGQSEYFEFCLLPWCEIGVIEVPYNSIFDLDNYEE